MTLTKDIIANQLKDQIGLSRSICGEIVDEFFKQIIELSAINGKVVLKNFGNFHVNLKKTRPGFNLKTSTLVLIPPRKVLRFSPAKELKNVLNKNLELSDLLDKEIK